MLIRANAPPHVNDGALFFVINLCGECLLVNGENKYNEISKYIRIWTQFGACGSFFLCTDYRA